MTLRDSYQRFLDNPSTGALAEDASLHYISTLISIHGATAITKHLSVQEKLLKKTGQEILDAVEGHQGLSVDVQTTIEFNNGGGAYLPGLDDNFVADRVVTFPMVHIVHFDHAGKIMQVRQYWDQGSLLKQIDVIGARSRNWPIRDGKDQTKLIAASSAAVTQPGSAQSSRPSTTSRGPDEISITSRGRDPTTTNVTNDPHASLSLFQSREIDEDVHNAHPMAPRALSAKPPPREYSELFVGANATSSPPLPDKIPVKAGAGKNFQSNRLFDEVENDTTNMATPSIRTNAKKFNHFDFGDESDETPKVRDTARAAIRGKHESHWDFEDFVTPEKTKPKTLPQAVRNISWSDDEDESSPVRRPIVHKARPDADAHFEFNDDGTPAAQRKQSTSSKGRASNNGQGLYQDHITGTTSDDDDNNSRRQQPSQRRHKATENNFDFYEESPKTRGINIAGNGMGNRAGTQFSLFDDDEDSHARKAPAHQGREQRGDGMGGRKDVTSEPTSTKPSGINIAGNGMGNRSGTQFSLFDDDSESHSRKAPVIQGREQRGDGMGGRKDVSSEPTSTKPSGINIAGNGMGNRAGTQFSLFDEESPVRNANPGREQHGDGMGGRMGESYSMTQSAKKENVQTEREQHGDGMGGRKDVSSESTSTKPTGINIAGNGMGNRKGTQFSLFDEESPAKKNENVGRAQHNDGMGGRKNADSFWDF